MSASQKSKQAILYTFFFYHILWFYIQLVQFLICSVDAEQFGMRKFILLSFVPA